MSDTYIEYINALKEAQYLPPRLLRAYQEKLLTPLIAHAVKTVPFYAERLAPLLADDGGVDFSRWEELPVLTRQEAADNARALKSSAPPEFAGPALESSTSGSTTGKAFRTWQSSLTIVAAASLMMDFYDWHEINPNRCIADIRMHPGGHALYPHGQVQKSWGPAVRAMGYKDGRYALLDVATPIADQAEWLVRLKPDYLFSYPSNLQALAEHFADRSDLELSFRKIMTVGEVLAPRCRDIAREVFGADIADGYGTAEAGYVASQCPMAQHHHVRAEAVRLEVLRDDGTPCAPNEVGRIVLTPFYNYTMPLFRYEIGDYGALSDAPCACGRTLPVLSKILGRARNVFTFTDGTRRFPITQVEDLGRFVALRKFQIVQTAADQIEVRYVPAREDTPVDLDGMTAYFRKIMHPSLKVTAIAMDEIPRSSGGKYEDHVSLVSG